MRLFLKILLAVTAIAISSLAPADGKFFVKTSRIEAQPMIPSQRAIILFDNNIETLIIDTDVNGPSGEYGWLIPIPSAARKVEKVENGTVEKALEVVAPPIYGLRELVNPFLVVFAFGGLFVAWTAPFRYKEKGWRALGQFIAELLICLLLASLGSTLSQPIRCLKSENVDNVRGLGVIGSYSVNEISGQDGRSAIQWLEKNGFYADEKSRGVISDYLERGWKFVSAKLRSDGQGKLKPHPIAIEFATRQAVYPMDLTVAGLSHPALKILVFSTGEARGGLLDAISCNYVGSYTNATWPEYLRTRLYSSWYVKSLRTGRHGSPDSDVELTFGPGEEWSAFLVDIAEKPLLIVLFGLGAAPISQLLIGLVCCFFGWKSAWVVVAMFVIGIVTYLINMNCNHQAMMGVETSTSSHFSD